MISKFSVRKPYTVFVAVIIVLIFGGISLYKMTPDLFPSINAPVAVVLTSDPGASAEETEIEITEPMEQQLATLPNVDELNSVSADNYSYITIVFNDEANMDAISVDIRDKIEQIRDQLPETAGTPVVMKINMDMLPVVVAAVSMKDKDVAEVSTFTRDHLLTPLEGTEGVASVNAVGMIDDGLQVVLDQERIDALNQEVKDAINGEIDDGKRKVRKGIKSAKSGRSKVKQGKGQVTEGEEKAENQMAKAKRKLLKQKAKLEATKTSLLSQRDQLLAQKDNLPALQDLAEKVTEALAEGNLELARQMLEAAGFTDIQQLQETIEQLATADVTQFDQPLQQIDSGIAQIEAAIEEIDSQSAELTFSLGTGYADLSATQSTLDITISELESTLKEIEGGRKAALSGADLDNIITMDNVASILGAQNFSMPAGYVSDGEAELLVSVGDKVRDADEMEDLILFDLDIEGVDPIRVRDIGTVIPASEDDESYARINGENGVLLSFSKQSTYATATVADNVDEKFETLMKTYEGLHFTALMDQGEYIHMVIRAVLNNLLLGALLAVLILLFFLRDIRPTIITAISIPVSVVFALALMYFSGVTLNMISLSGLAIGIGMLVDNSIVVIENTYRLRSMGYSLVQAAVSGSAQVAGAITASTLTTICVFAPIIFVDGITKEIFVDLALTVTYSLMASLLIALTLVPAMAKGMLVRTPGKTVLGQGGRVVRRYKQAAAWGLSHKKWILIGAVVLLIASSGLLLTRGFEYMPSIASPQISVQVQMPEDSTLEETSAVNDEMMEAVRKVDGVETAAAMLAANLFTVDSGGGEQDVTQTTMYIVMEDGKVENSRQVVDILEGFEKKYDLEVTTSADQDMTSYMGGSDIQITLYTDDLDDLRTSAHAVEDRLRQMKQVEEVSDIMESSTEEVHITIDKNRAMKKGLTVAQAYQQIAAKLQKEKSATRLKQEGTTIEVNVENAASDFTLEELEDLRLTVDKQDGTKKHIRLTSIADIEQDASLTEIAHASQRRSAEITASLKDGYNITKVTDQVRSVILDEHLVKSGVQIDFGGQDEEIMDAMGQLLLMMIAGLLLVYLVMMAQFQSIRSPLIIIFTIPLAFTGGMFALLISGQVMSVVAMFGLVMLMGIVVNNGIVLVDTINRFRLEGMERDEAIIRASAIRMRPVLMTAATTVLGLLPLALGFGNGAEMVQPVAITCIGGLIYGTVTTLFVIPVMYRLLGRRHMEKIQDEELEILTV